MRLIFLNFIFSLAVAAHAAPRSGDALKTEFKGGKFTASLKEGFHFNEKAPNSVIVDGKAMQPIKTAARDIEFAALPQDWTAGQAALYVCDDELTFCETRMIPLREGGATAAPPQDLKTKSVAKASSGKTNRFGFIEDDYTKALTQTQGLKKLMLIDFSARWCPGCVRLENEIFGRKEFKAMTQDLVKLKIDVDRFENTILVEKFKVKGIPSLIVVNEKQEEVARLVDYQPLEILTPFFAAIKADPASLNELMSKASAADQAVLLRLGQRLLIADRAADAVIYLRQVQPVPAELLKAKVDAAEASFNADKGNRSQYVAALKEAIQTEPASTRSLDWRSQLIGALEDKAEIKKVADEGVALADSLLSDSKKLKEALKNDTPGEFTGFEPLWVAMIRADLVESSGANQTAIDAAWKRAGQVGKDLKIPFTKAGISLRHLIVLTKAQMYSDADRVALALMKMDPGNAELPRRRLKILLEQKKYEETISLGKMVLPKSYGRNEFLAAEVIAKAYVAAKRNKEARKFIDSYLARQEIGWASMASIKNTLEELKGQLQ